jgi:hypothetical protein
LLVSFCLLIVPPETIYKKKSRAGGVPFEETQARSSNKQTWNNTNKGGLEVPFKKNKNNKRGATIWSSPRGIASGEQGVGTWNSKQRAIQGSSK